MVSREEDRTCYLRWTHFYLVYRIWYDVWERCIPFTWHPQYRATIDSIKGKLASGLQDTNPHKESKAGLKRTGIPWSKMLRDAALCSLGTLYMPIIIVPSWQLVVKVDEEHSPCQYLKGWLHLRWGMWQLEHGQQWLSEQLSPYCLKPYNPGQLNWQLWEPRAGWDLSQNYFLHPAADGNLEFLLLEILPSPVSSLWRVPLKGWSKSHRYSDAYKSEICKLSFLLELNWRNVQIAPSTFR